MGLASGRLETLAGDVDGFVRVGLEGFLGVGGAVVATVVVDRTTGFDGTGHVC